MYKSSSGFQAAIVRVWGDPWKVCMTGIEEVCDHDSEFFRFKDPDEQSAAIGLIAGLTAGQAPEDFIRTFEEWARFGTIQGRVVIFTRQ